MPGRGVGVQFEAIEDLVVVVARGLVGVAAEVIGVGPLEADVAAAGLVQERVVTDIVERHPVVSDAIDASAYSLLVSTPGTLVRAHITNRESAMPYTISKVDVWTRAIDDRAGSLAATLEPLADAGVDLAFLIARRRTLVPGKGVVFLGGITTAKGAKAAAAAEFEKAKDIIGLRVEGPNKPGDAHRVVRILGDAGISLRGLSASVIGKKYVLILGFDSAADADKATRLLRSAGK